MVGSFYSLSFVRHGSAGYIYTSERNQPGPAGFLIPNWITKKMLPSPYLRLKRKSVMNLLECTLKVLQSFFRSGCLQSVILCREMVSHPRKSVG